MSRTSRHALAPAFLFVAVASLAGCGKGGDSKQAPPSETAVAVAATEAPADKGAATYAQICQSCHQATGLGVDGTFPPLKGSKWLLGNPDVPISIVIAGLQGEIEVNEKEFNGVMQAWGMLSDDDIANVLTYARSQWGNAAGAVTPAQVKAIRDKIGSRGAWTSEELKKTYPGAGS